MGKVLRIAIPKEFLTRDLECYLLWHNCKKVSENKNFAAFEMSPHSMRMPFELFGILTYRRKRDFYDGLAVGGGRKAFSRQEVVINPFLDKEVHLRVTEEAYQFVRETAKKRGYSISGYLRSFITKFIFEQEQEPKSEKAKKGREIALRSLGVETEI